MRWEYRCIVDTETCTNNIEGKQTFIRYMYITNIVTVTCDFLKGAY